eukprot:m.335598 g.335598  ORF g.335598 m.335598 type:complete len:117 (-) comp17635_c0_seq1:976-1326(-)
MLEEEGKRLTCSHCTKPSGDRGPTTIMISECEGGDISNLNGKLGCVFPTDETEKEKEEEKTPEPVRRERSQPEEEDEDDDEDEDEEHDDAEEDNEFEPPDTSDYDEYHDGLAREEL